MLSTYFTSQKVLKGCKSRLDKDVKSMVLEWFWQDPSVIPTSLSIINRLYSFTQNNPKMDFISTTVISMIKLHFTHNEFMSCMILTIKSSYFSKQH